MAYSSHSLLFFLFFSRIHAPLLRIIIGEEKDRRKRLSSFLSKNAKRKEKDIYIYTEFAAIPIPNPELEFDFFLCDCARQGLYRCILGLVSLLQILTRSEWGVRGVTCIKERVKKKEK